MLATIETPTKTTPIGRLRPNPANPRGPIAHDAALDELAASIRAQGILMPLLVTREGVIVAGHRRYEAAKLAELQEVPVLIRDMSESEQLAAMLIENLQRSDLSPLQEARAYDKLREATWSVADIARQIGCSAKRIQDRLAILRLEPEVQEMFDRNELPITLIALLGKVTDSGRQRRLAMLSAQRKISVAQLEKIIAEEPAVTAKPAPKAIAQKPVRKGTTRRKALELLQAHGGRKFSGADLAEAMDEICGICARCGMASVEAICQECALPDLVERLCRS